MQQLIFQLEILEKKMTNKLFSDLGPAHDLNVEKTLGKLYAIREIRSLKKQCQDNREKQDALEQPDEGD